MDVGSRIETALERAVGLTAAADGPPKLAAAIRYSVFPGGHRIRPRLSLAVAQACGDTDPRAADAAAAAIELLHCASLVHDDLPAFDDAETRRGKLTVHKAYGEPLAVLAGDALIVLGFEVLARESTRFPKRLSALVTILAKAVGAPHGLCAGQAWECEPEVSVAAYQRAKTGSLFAAAALGGAAASGHFAPGWQVFGERLGEAYQVADDIRDVFDDPTELGKPVGQDAALGRPSAVAEHGMDGAIRRVKMLVSDALEAIPDCPGAAHLRLAVGEQTRRFLPAELARRAA